MKPALKFSKLFFLISLLGIVALFATRMTVLAGYGEAATAPVCNNQAPDKPWLYLVSLVGDGEVKVFWDRVERATSWTVAYGRESGKYPYGISNFGNSSSRSVGVNGLPAGVYYFVVRANNDCMPGPFSNEWSIKLGKGTTVVTTTRELASPRVSSSPTEQSRVSPTPTVRYQPRVTQAPQYPSPVIGRSAPLPTPTPSRGFFQRIMDFIVGLFGR